MSSKKPLTIYGGQLKELTTGDSIPSDCGGTGFVSFATGDILFGHTDGTLIKLPLGTTGQNIAVSAGVPIWSTPSADWKLSGNTGTDPTINFVGTIDAKDLVFKVNNTEVGRYKAATRSYQDWQSLATGAGSSATSYGNANGGASNASTYGNAGGYLSDATTYGTASGNYSNASTEGVAAGSYSHASTRGRANSDYTVASTFGTANATYSIASTLGTANGSTSNASTYGSANGILSNASTYGIASGNYSNASTNATASGEYSNASTLGLATATYANATTHGRANGGSSNASSWGIAAGDYTNASTYGTATGIGSDANTYGTANGLTSNASTYGVSQGISSNASTYAQSNGLASFATTGSTSGGDYSSAHGMGMQIKGYSGAGVGSYNDISAVQNSTAYAISNRAFEIGIGSLPALRQNAVTVLFNGNVGIGTVTPQYTVDTIGATRTIGNVLIGDVVGDVNTSASAALVINSTSKGIVIPRMTSAQRIAIAAPVTGLEVYDITENCLNTYDGLSWVIQPNTTNGITAPSTIPLRIGDEYINTVTRDIYISTGTTVVADWSLTNVSTAVNYISSGTLISTTSLTDVAATGLSISPLLGGTYSVLLNSAFSTITSPPTAIAQVDLNTLYNALISLPGTNVHAATFGTETLFAGVYDIAAAGSIAGIVTLDAAGNSNAVFVFRFAAAFSTGAASQVQLINGATAQNVYWIAEGAIGIGANCLMKGVLLAHAGAISMGATCTIMGRLFSTSGAIGINGCSVIIPPPSSNFTLGILEYFALFSTTSALTNAGSSYITGDIGTNGGTISGFDPDDVTGNIYTPSTLGNASVIWSVYQNGVLVPFSSRERTTLQGIDITLHCMATILPNQPIAVYWNTTMGTARMHNRTFSVNHVSS